MKMIKKITYLFAATLVLAGTSCKKTLDIQPQQNIDANVALQNIDDVKSAVTGLYGLMGNGALYGTNLNVLSELQGSDNYVSWRGTFQSYRQIANKNIVADNADVLRTWTNSYRAIILANNIIDKLNTIDPSNTKEKGEAYFVRGALYFELVRFYGLPYINGATNSQLGVPIVTSTVYNEAQASAKTARSTVEQVYAQAEADLLKAATFLPTVNDKRLTKYAAMAFLSRLYLQKAGTAATGDANLVKARDYAHQVISSNAFGLNPLVTIAFNNRNSAESIFEIQQNDQNNAGTSNDGLTTFYASLPGSVGRADIRLLAAFVNQYEATDDRKTLLTYIGTGARPGNTYTAKWTDFGQNIPVVRLAEMYLTRAEANYRLGTTIGNTPLDDVNLVRARAKATPFTTLTSLDNITNERALELAFEGLRIHDIKRLKKSSGSFAYNDRLLVFPIPDREIKANNLLVQN